MKRFALALAATALLTVSAPTFAQDEPASPVFEPGVCAYEEGTPTTQDCLDLMTARGKLQFDRAPIDGTTIGYYSFYKVGPDPINKYDAPGGNIVGEIPAGFNFVTAMNEDNPEWLQIRGGQWISRATATIVSPSRFTGVVLPDNWDQPFAWVLDTTGIWSSTIPGVEGTQESGYLTRRYDMVNIYAEAYDSEGWRWYMIGPNQWLKQTFVAKVQPSPHPKDADEKDVTGRWVAVDLYEQTLIAYEDDKPVFATLIASGLQNFDTNEGLFNIWARLPDDRMSGATGAPSAYDLQSVPWVMYFDGSISLHGTYWHDYFGYRRSHGCVNLSISDARWIFNWTNGATPEEDGSIMNYVYVFSSGKYGEAPHGFANG
ncbi:MAG: L,D-transpeptidase [Chloroflexi bacterium]|nr:L,D-transpeptidase [Chloroflexota bacterium]MCC6895480.1 L,D-transpeptidase [Anaerolineae bacterium]